MDGYEKAFWAIGYDPPLVDGGDRATSYRREVSSRWLTGLGLTAATGLVLVGMSLVTALEGRIVGTDAADRAAPPRTGRVSLDSVAKAGRVDVHRVAMPPADRRRIEASTRALSDGGETLRRTAFVQVRMALGAVKGDADYPPFDPLDAYAEEGAREQAGVGALYPGAVESNVSLRVVDFSADTDLSNDRELGLNDAQAEFDARRTDAATALGSASIEGFSPVDPVRFGGAFAGLVPLQEAVRSRVVLQNVSIAGPTMSLSDRDYREEAIPVSRGRALFDELVRLGYEADAGAIASALYGVKGEDVALERLLRIGVERRGDTLRVARATIYANAEHVGTAALNDLGEYVPAPEPLRRARVSAAAGVTAVSSGGDGLTVYDAINRAALDAGLTPRLVRQIVRLLADEVDYRAPLDPTDRLELVFSEPDITDAATAGSEIHYLRFAFSGKYGSLYRFETDEGTADYFGAEGRNTREALLRNPVPNAHFTSSYGMRRHPLLGYTRMHTGVDWAAPTGAPILAAAPGIVEAAGWKGGYGRQTRLRHANGYETSYSHQSRIAAGIVPGATVRQGQIIGFVGATGMVTGSHLHFEVSINGAKVDPMRVRLPESRVLKGPDLEAFLAERDRIDALIYDAGETPLRVAANSR